MALTSMDIIHIINPFRIGNIFKGVFACDTLPRNFSLPAAFIINLSKHDSVGSHWVGLFINNDKIAEYFDSFAFPPIQDDIVKFIRKNSIKLNYNKKQIQHLSSVKCGKYVILFILSKMLNKNFNEIINRFSSNLTVNELVIENIFNYFNQEKNELIYQGKI